MNEIAKLIETYNRMWKDIELMRHDIVTVFEDEFGMECYLNSKWGDFLLFNILFKDKIICYIELDMSCEIPCLQIIKLEVITEKSITKDFLKDNEYKDWNALTDGDPEIKEINKYFSSLKSLKYDEYNGVISPKIDIMSIDSTDTVHSEIKNLISCLINNKLDDFNVKKLKLL